MQAVAHRGNFEFIVAESPAALEPGRIVDLTLGTVSPPIKIGSIVAQSSPDDWQSGPGTDADAADRAVALVVQERLRQ